MLMDGLFLSPGTSSHHLVTARERTDLAKAALAVIQGAQRICRRAKLGSARPHLA
jgi:hypothetical protein